MNTRPVPDPSKASGRTRPSTRPRRCRPTPSAPSAAAPPDAGTAHVLKPPHRFAAAQYLPSPGPDSTPLRSSQRACPRRIPRFRPHFCGVLIFRLPSPPSPHRRHNPPTTSSPSRVRTALQLISHPDYEPNDWGPNGLHIAFMACHRNTAFGISKSRYSFGSNDRK